MIIFILWGVVMLHPIERHLTFRSRGRVQAALARAPELARSTPSSMLYAYSKSLRLPTPRNLRTQRRNSRLRTARAAFPASKVRVSRQALAGLHHLVLLPASRPSPPARMPVVCCAQSLRSLRNRNPLQNRAALSSRASQFPFSAVCGRTGAWRGTVFKLRLNPAPQAKR